MVGNTLIFGFKSFKELFSTIFGFKTIGFNLSLSFFATTNAFIQDYIYDDAKAVYFLVFLILFDAVTGVWKAIKQRVFCSARLPRILILLVLYVMILGISWNAARFSDFYFWLPPVMYGGMMGTLIVSIFENLMELGYIPNSLYQTVKNRIKSIFGPSSKENKRKNRTSKKEKPNQ